MSKINEFWKTVKSVNPNQVKIHEGTDDSEINRYSVSVLHLTKDQAKTIQKKIRKLLTTERKESED